MVASTPTEAPSAEDSTSWTDLLRRHGPIALLIAIGGALRSFALGQNPGSLIGDEAWYVPAARVIAGFPVLPSHLRTTAHNLVDPNTEHPPLAKVIMALFMRALGNTEIAWRIPSVILGTSMIWLVYAIVLKLRGTRMQALMAAFVMTFENLTLVHGRIATLDIYLVAFSLLGTLLYLSSYLELAALAFAIATLCKTNAVLGVFTLILYEAILERSGWRTPSWQALRRRALVFGLYIGFFLLGLGALDCFFTEFTGPIAHLKFMGQFHSKLKSTGAPVGTHSLPMQWWLNLGNFSYYQQTVTRHGTITRHLWFQALMNGYVIYLAPLALLVSGLKMWRGRSPLATFAIASFLGNFGPIFLAWAVFSRTSYIYYMLPTIPAFACAFGVVAKDVPSKIRWGFVALVLFSCAYQYPIRAL